MRVLIADDHPMVRDALCRTVRIVEENAAITEARNLAEIETALQCQPDLAVLDIHMPGLTGIDTIARLHLEYPQVRMVVVSGEDDPAMIRSVLATGVAGFLPKSEEPAVLIQALRLVLSGGVYMPPRALGDLGQSQRRLDPGGLTPRQADVLRLLVKGQPNKLIARDLGLTEGTVKIHIAAILRALQARNRTEAVVIARRLRLD
jgi:DNA-binding NarL/FixJ family response regulator